MNLASVRCSLTVRVFPLVDVPNLVNMYLLCTRAGIIVVSQNNTPNG
jgi:hypothetical protein